MYSLTEKDVEEYLDGKKPEDVIGTSCDIHHCLLANVVHEKYPELLDVQVCEEGIYAFRGPRSSFQRVIPMTASLGEVMNIMDLYTDEEQARITKAAYLRARALYELEEDAYEQATA